MQLGAADGAAGRKRGKKVDVVCYRCGLKGHMKKDCRVNLEKKGKRQNGGFSGYHNPQQNGGKLAKLEGDLAEMQKNLASVVQILAGHANPTPNQPLNG